MNRYEKLFKNMSQRLAVAELYQFLEDRQNKDSYKDGFGYGFQRWVISLHLLQHLNSSPQRQHQFTYTEVREMYKYLASIGLVDIKQSHSRGMLSYSTKGWNDCDTIDDYFVERNHDDKL